MSKTVDYLMHLGVIDPNTANIIMQVNGITNMAIHGADVSKGQFYFVQDTAPNLIAILKEINIKDIDKFSLIHLDM